MKALGTISASARRPIVGLAMRCSFWTLGTSQKPGGGGELTSEMGSGFEAQINFRRRAPSGPFMAIGEKERLAQTGIPVERISELYRVSRLEMSCFVVDNVRVLRNCKMPAKQRPFRCRISAIGVYERKPRWGTPKGKISEDWVLQVP